MTKYFILFNLMIPLNCFHGVREFGENPKLYPQL
jgi:hypothetical protein